MAQSRGEVHGNSGTCKDPVQVPRPGHRSLASRSHLLAPRQAGPRRAIRRITPREAKVKQITESIIKLPLNCLGDERHLTARRRKHGWITGCTSQKGGTYLLCARVSVGRPKKEAISLTRGPQPGPLLQKVGDVAGNADIKEPERPGHETSISPLCRQEVQDAERMENNTADDSMCMRSPVSTWSSRNYTAILRNLKKLTHPCSWPFGCGNTLSAFPPGFVAGLMATFPRSSETDRPGYC